jgi:hypothetical protein
MCKASVESNIKSQKNNFGVGLNKGILYLLAMPYILAGIGGILWYRKKKEIKKHLNSTSAQ